MLKLLIVNIITRIFHRPSLSFASHGILSELAVNQIPPKCIDNSVTLSSEQPAISLLWAQVPTNLFCFRILYNFFELFGKFSKSLAQKIVHI